MRKIFDKKTVKKVIIIFALFCDSLSYLSTCEILILQTFSKTQIYLHISKIFHYNTTSFPYIVVVIIHACIQ